MADVAAGTKKSSGAAGKVAELAGAVTGSATSAVSTGITSAAGAQQSMQLTALAAEQNAFALLKGQLEFSKELSKAHGKFTEDIGKGATN